MILTSFRVVCQRHLTTTPAGGLHKQFDDLQDEIIYLDLGERRPWFIFEITLIDSWVGYFLK